MRIITPEKATQYAVDLANKNKYAVGFVPSSRVLEYAQTGQLKIKLENNDLCGFLIHSGGWPTVKIYQACIQYDARQRHHGMELIGDLVRASTARQCSDIVLWCADDLEANDFWKMAGFKLSGVRDGRVMGGRKHNLWVLQLDVPRLIDGTFSSPFTRYRPVELTPFGPKKYRMADGQGSFEWQALRDHVSDYCSLKPLDQVDLSRLEERRQLNLFLNECEEMCGV